MACLGTVKNLWFCTPSGYATDLGYWRGAVAQWYNTYFPTMEKVQVQSLAASSGSMKDPCPKPWTAAFQIHGCIRSGVFHFVMFLGLHQMQKHYKNVYLVFLPGPCLIISILFFSLWFKMFLKTIFKRCLLHSFVLGINLAFPSPHPPPLYTQWYNCVSFFLWNWHLPVCFHYDVLRPKMVRNSVAALNKILILCAHYQA